MRAAVLATGLLIVATGCPHQGDRSGTRALVVYCAAGLRPPMVDLAEEFQRETGIRMEINYGGSNLMLSQLKLTGHGDLFIPGDMFYIEEAEREGLIRHTRRIARFAPVILVQKGNPRSITSLADLTRPGLRLAIGDERAPAIGRTSRALFAGNNLPWDAVQRNTVFSGVTVHELADSVRLGHSDATLVWRPVALMYRETCEIVDIPAAQNIPADIAVAVLRVSQNEDAARAFVEWAAGPEGRAIFERHAYDVVEEQGNNG